MKIVADENIPGLEAFFGDLGSIHARPGRSLQSADVRDADVLLVRSVTRVDKGLLAGSRVRFVGTATIGTDHMDTGWLKEQGIGWSAAPGCNAAAVVDYVLAVLARLSRCDDRSIRDYSVGIVGAGNVGGRLRQRLEALGLRVCVNDPPLQARGGEGPFSSLETALEQDLICLHTPLVRDGPHPTHHLIDEQKLAHLSAHQTLLNAGRGAVVDNAALLARLQKPEAPRAVLDVWENEPGIDAELFRSVWLGTPHIAGYSLEGKLRGTAMISEALRRHEGTCAGPDMAEMLPPAATLQLSTGCDDSRKNALAQTVLAAYDPGRDSAALGSALEAPDGEGRAQAFDRLRRDYPVRREFAFTCIQGQLDKKTATLLAAAGFRTGQ